MVQLSSYPRMAASGVDDILNELRKRRIEREQGEQEQFGGNLKRSTLSALDETNAMQGIGQPEGANENPLLGGEQQQPFGRDFYGSLRHLQNVQLKGLGLGDPTRSLIQGSQGYTLGTRIGGGGKMPRGAGSARKSYGGGVKGQVRTVAGKFGWAGGKEWAALVRLVQKESSWNPKAANPTSSARGLFQKMTSIHGGVEGSAAGQAKWGLNYIKGRYGSPSKALAFHNRNNWY